MEAEVDPQLEVEAVWKTGLHEQCEVDDLVIDNIGLEGDPIDYNMYNKVVGLCLGGHHKSPQGLDGTRITEVSGEALEC